MNKNSKSPKVIKLTEAQRKELSNIACSRTERHSRVERTKFILDFANAE